MVPAGTEGQREGKAQEVLGLISKNNIFPTWYSAKMYCVAASAVWGHDASPSPHLQSGKRDSQELTEEKHAIPCWKGRREKKSLEAEGRAGQREGLGKGCGTHAWQIRPDKGAVRDDGCHTIIYKLISGKTKGLCKPNTQSLEKIKEKTESMESLRRCIGSIFLYKNETKKMYDADNR